MQRVQEKPSAAATGLRDLPLYAVMAASDIARAEAWYREKLGLEPAERDAQTGSLWYQTGGQWFLLYATPNAGTARNTVAHWTVPDLPATMADLRKRGVKFEDYDFGEVKTVDGLLEAGGGRAAWFTDSEGNIIELTQPAR